jgi:hypothetical protein
MALFNVTIKICETIEILTTKKEKVYLSFYNYSKWVNNFFSFFFKQEGKQEMKNMREKLNVQK